jgi:hypothetical protein
MTGDVFHVTGSDDDGIYMPGTFDRKFPQIFAAMEEHDADHIQFGDSEGQVIVTRSDASDFDLSQIQ